MECINFEDLKICYKIDNIETYPPQEDSFLLLETLREYPIENKIVLDLGCGSGILGIYAKKRGAKFVTFADIDKDAIEISKFNYKQNFGILSGAEFIISNLFEKIPKAYDIILFNPPYLPETGLEDQKTKLWTVGGKIGNEILESFLQQAYKHLNKDGKILLVYSSLSDPFYVFRKFVSVYKIKTINKKRFFFEELYVYELTLRK